MEEITERMAVVLQWILDDGEGGKYRGDIQAALVAYDALKTCDDCKLQWTSSCPSLLGKKCRYFQDKTRA